MNLAIAQLRRAPARTGLLVLVVAVLLFLLEYLAAVSSSLQALDTGALAHLHADVFVYSRGGADSLDASRLPIATVAAAARVPGVAEAEPLGTADFTITGPDGQYELDLIGLGTARQIWPTVTAGGLPGPGQALADGTEAAAGLTAGSGIILAAGGITLRVSGTGSGLRYDGLVTAWTTFGSWTAAVHAANPGTPVPNAVVVRARPGVPPAVLAARLAAALPTCTVLTQAEAVADVPGAGVLSVTFGLLIAVAFAAAVLVVSSVFLLVTVQRSRVWVLLRGLGATAGRLGMAVVVQAMAVVLAATAVASIILAVVAAVSGPGFPVRAAPGLITATVAAAACGAFVSCLLPVRRIARIDPAAALVRP